MTRKCAICRETNYKNGSSFFSAPKDPQTRQLWQEVIGIENCVIKDETYVCSKHFYSTDIITHWVSGVPPNVVTIKYKKFRLRPGAVPKINIEPNEIDPQFIECENEFTVNRGCSPTNILSLTSAKAYEIYSIPRENFNEAIETIHFEDFDSQESFEIISEFTPKVEIKEIPSDYNSEEDDNNTKEEQEKGVEENEFIPNVIEHFNVTFEEKEICLIDGQNVCLEVTNFKNEHTNNESGCNEAMLFEDLLEIYTEVNLPKGWNSFVISKGLKTTIVYCFMAINQAGLPAVEKQVFVKNNMVLRCSVKNKGINPLVHNLIKDQNNLTVKTLADVEKLIQEFNKRQICSGNPVNNSMSEDAYKDGSNWRHNCCSLIINSGSSRCQKCSFLSKRKSTFAHDSYSVGKSKMDEREKRLKDLSESIEEEMKSKDEDRLPTLSQKTIHLMSEIVNKMKLPEIQKVMIKECFKAEENEEENDIQFSRTWIFLCLLLYIESPDMYKYMLLNKYMNLPPLFTVRAYLRRVKSDREFYKIFQESVESFQPFNEELSTEHLK